MRSLIVAFLLVTVGASWAADIVVTDGDTIQLDRMIYRLDGVDAPEIDQMCLDQSGDIWQCGVTARDRLSAYIGNRAVRCEDKGLTRPTSTGGSGFVRSKAKPKHSMSGSFKKDGRLSTNLTQRVVSRQRKLTHARTGADCGKDVSQNRATCDDGISMPRDLSESVVQAGHENRTREKLFRVDTDMPPGCPIKAKLALRAEIVGYEGIYHLPGCGSYRRLKRANRWFCSEEDALAAGFRKALTCR